VYAICRTNKPNDLTVNGGRSETGSRLKPGTISGVKRGTFNGYESFYTEDS